MVGSVFLPCSADRLEGNLAGYVRSGFPVMFCRSPRRQSGGKCSGKCSCDGLATSLKELCLEMFGPVLLRCFPKSLKAILLQTVGTIFLRFSDEVPEGKNNMAGCVRPGVPAMFYLKSMTAIWLDMFGQIVLRCSAGFGKVLRRCTVGIYEGSLTRDVHPGVPAIIFRSP